MRSLTFTLPLLACLSALPLAAQDVAEGKALFQNFCATCHGPGGTGAGPTAEIMTIEPANLTRLSAENQGTFPLMRVLRTIDGRDPLVAHGSPMPLFGEYFEGQGAAIKTPAGQPILTSQPLVDLVTWLKTIQVD